MLKNAEPEKRDLRLGSASRRHNWMTSEPMAKNNADEVNADARQEIYKVTGVDTAEADAGLGHIIRRVQATWPKSGPGRVVLPIGYFANVIAVDGAGIALCTDGVGSKTMIAAAMAKYDTIGIDCVAMNVNDMICVGARPLSLLDYIAIEKADAAMLDAIAVGLCVGAKMADISISGGETAQLKDIMNGFDLVGMAVGQVDLDKVISGKSVAEGDVVIGVRSSGIHSNGLSLARSAFFKGHSYGINHKFDELNVTLGEELLRPTDIYVPEAMEILQKVRGIKALINITSDGLLNLARVEAEVGFEIDHLIEPHPIFSLIQRHANVPDYEMFEVFNMGIGFCYVVSPGDVELTISILEKHNRQAQRIGYAVSDPRRHVRIQQKNLLGYHKSFKNEDRSTRKFG
jgi:phosphoribosylformylglycinamidine cyclo-ligase